MSTKPINERRFSSDSLASIDSNSTFDGEMDNYINTLLSKNSASNKERIDDYNTSEEKGKRELKENEKGKPTDSPDLERSASRAKYLQPEVIDIKSPKNKEKPVGMETDTNFTPNDDDSADEYADDFELTDSMTEEQRRAMLELQQMCLDLAEVGNVDEEPPEYNVKARVRQLNEELAANPLPAEDERRRSIKFKDNLVDLVAPPPDYPSDDEDGLRDTLHDKEAQKVQQEDNKFVDLNLNQMNLNGGAGDAPKKRTGGIRFKEVDVVQQTQDPVGIGDGDGLPIKPAEPVSNGTAEPEDEHVLVQRGKTFELISAKDLTAEERDIFLPFSDDIESNDTNKGNQPESSPTSNKNASTGPAPSPTDSSFRPKPPREPRPATASAAQSRRPMSTAPRRRTQSATPTRKTNHGGVNISDSYRSPYAQADSLKQLGERRKKDIERKKKQEKEIAALENNQKQRENEDAFVAWLNIKRKSNAWQRPSSAAEDAKVKRKSGKDSPDTESLQDKESEAAFTGWLKAKRVQQRREKHVEELKQDEEEQGWYDRPRQDCDKAFRQWLKKKNQDTKKTKKQEVARLRISKLLVRRTRKAMQLARAIKQSQNFRYVDYYGYRY